MMRFKDFPIKVLVDSTWISDAKGEQVDETILRINSWVEDNEHIVLNIETLFFLNLDENQSSTGAPIFKDVRSTGTSTKHYQVFRVWYKETST